MRIPNIIPNWIDGKALYAQKADEFDKINPVDEEKLYGVTRSGDADVSDAVKVARSAQSEWSKMPGVERGQVLMRLVVQLQTNAETIAAIVAKETGRSLKDARGEVQGAIALGSFYCGEGQRLYARTTTSGVVHRQAMTIRQPVGIAGLIVSANTPIANIAWKVFPALICGNGVVLKAAEDAPATAWYFGKLAQDAGILPGILNIIQGYGPEAGAALVNHRDVGVVSFTGSREVGVLVQRLAGKRLAKVSLELGGKNPMVICDDADIESAVKWSIQSAFSLAGQRCASASRIIIFRSVYESFKKQFVAAAKRLRMGVSEEDDLGPLINKKALAKVLTALEEAKKEGVTVLTGGERQSGEGFFIQPTIIEGASPDAEISRTELFGPVTCLYPVDSFEEALKMANDSPFGLTACVHTANINRALQFTQMVEAGVVMVNAGTFGSEPHMPFGGVKESGNGSREPGTEAIDIYTNIKNVYLNSDPAAC